MLPNIVISINRQHFYLSTDLAKKIASVHRPLEIRLDIFENHRTKLSDLSRSDEDYRALLISDMTSDREDGFDEFDKPMFIRKAPIYRSVEVSICHSSCNDISHITNINLLDSVRCFLTN